MWQYRSTEELYHSDDYLMHYGVLGMKWRNHRYKKKINKINNTYNKAFKAVEDAKKGTKEGYDFKIKAKNNKTKYYNELENAKAKNSNNQSDRIGKQLALKSSLDIGGSLLSGTITKGIFDRLSLTKNIPDKLPAIAGVAAGLAAHKIISKPIDKINTKDYYKGLYDEGYLSGLQIENKKEYNEIMKNYGDSISELKNSYDKEIKSAKKKYKQK